MSDDVHHMRRAIALASKRVGLTGANPAVGCVLAKGADVLGEAATGEGGRPHAEEQALELAGSRAQGVVAYVTLEPCAARSGGTASCSERLVQAGVAKVVIACADASVFAAGHGTERLRGAGIEVVTGFLQEEAAALYETYRPAK